MLSLVKDFGFVEWWKAIAIVLTGVFAFLALAKESKDKKTGRLTRWGAISILGILLSSAGGLLAQIIESSNQAVAEKRRHDEVVAILTDQKRLLTPFKIERVYGEFNVPCQKGYSTFCDAVRTFVRNNPNGIMPISVFDAFPGGRGAIVILSLRFFGSEDEAKAQLFVQEDRNSKYSAYMQLPVLAGDDNKCGMRATIFPPTGDVRLFIYASCGFIGVNNYGGLQSHLDLNGLVFSTYAVPAGVNVPPLEPVQIAWVYPDASRDTATNLSRISANNQSIYVTKVIATGAAGLPKRSP